LSEQIRIATTPADFEAFAGLVTEYVAWCRIRYQAHPWFVDRVFGHQSLASELAALSASYSPPKGLTLVAVRDGRICGAGAYRRLADGTCEMKRLFVSDRCKGTGIGRRLCAAIIAHARDEGFALMRLDTANLMTEAVGLYESLGFRHCEPYHEYPAELRPYIVFMELALSGDAAPGRRTS
jgi:ribosomal protein S18 acetylase RimI-like enzyme